MPIDKIIIDNQLIDQFEECNISLEYSKKQILLLDFSTYPCYLICFKNGVANILAVIDRNSESYNKYEKNKLIDVDSIVVMEEDAQMPIKMPSPTRCEG